MRLTSTHDGEDHPSRLRKALERAYQTHHSLTHPEVLQASQELDKEIVRIARAKKAQQSLQPSLQGQPSSQNNTQNNTRNGTRNKGNPSQTKD